MDAIVFIIIIGIAIFKERNKLFGNINSKHSTMEVQKRNNKIRTQTNRISREVEREENKMDYLDSLHNEYECKYTTRDPSFSFEGKPNNFDDFAELRKRNNEHERHLEKRIY